MTAFAVELPFVPVDESETDTVTTAVSDKDTPIVKEKQTSTTVTTQLTLSYNRLVSLL